MTVTAASVDGDTLFITQKGRIYEMQRKDIFK